MAQARENETTGVDTLLSYNEREALPVSTDLIGTLQLIREQLNKQNEVISVLGSEVKAMSRHSRRLQEREDVISEAKDAPQAEAIKAWNEIKSFSILSSEHGLLDSYTSNEKHSLSQLFSPEMPWNSWAYQKSFPRLSTFLKNGANAIESQDLSLKCMDKTENNKIIVHQSQPSHFNYESAWMYLSTRYTESLEENTISDGLLEPGRGWSLAKLRILRAIDISPLLCVMFIASTQTHLSIVAQFLDRHLSFSNWSNMALKHLRSQTLNALTIEYHIAFYSFVPGVPGPSKRRKRDIRGLRRIASFGPDDDLSTGQLYEEQRSFLYIGLGVDWGTCFQLYDRSYVTSMSGFDIDQAYYDGPIAIFLAWLYGSMRHARFRWEKAIEALNSTIETPVNIVFSGENTDLLADDIRFSKSRTYFWALQVYKMFERRLDETITIWESFAAEHEFDMFDGIMPRIQINIALERINYNVGVLRDLRNVVRKKQEEVESLRRGLFGASALFDSRSAVRQGDNIQLLTYVTIFFLPLSFSASIFGMQVVLPSLPIKVLIIVMPTIFVLTFLVVLNLESMTYFGELATSYFTERLRRLMKRRHVPRWHATERALYHDKISRKAPNRKLPREATHWKYFVFALDFAILQFPVQEIQWARQELRRKPSHDLQKKAQSHPQSRAARVLAFKASEAQETQRHLFRINLLRISKSILTLFRLFLLPFWLTLAFVQYVFLLVSSIATCKHDDAEISTANHSVHYQVLNRMGFDTIVSDNASVSRIYEPRDASIDSVRVSAANGQGGFKLVKKKGWAKGNSDVDAKRKRWRRAINFQASRLNPGLRPQSAGSSQVRAT